MGRGSPRVVLHTEAESASPGERFAGFWVTCWRSRHPVVQINAGAGGLVARATAPAAGEDAADLVASATLFLAADTALLPAAAESGTPTVYLSGSPAGETAPPAAAGAPLCVVPSPTWFRRDTLLRDVHAAIERLVPDLLTGERSESSKCRERLAPWLQGKIADLGHGGHKIRPDATGVDFFRHDERDWIGDVRDLWFFDDATFDTVYSSHCLEDLWHPHQALDEWTRVLRPGGHLVLYLPLRDFYPNVGTPGANPGHKDDYVPEDVERFLRDLGSAHVVHAARHESESAFEVVARKAAPRSMVTLTAPAPSVSVLVIGECKGSAISDARALVATAETAHASLADAPHELLVLARSDLAGDARAMVLDLRSRLRLCEVIEDRAAWPLALRVEKVLRRARGETIVVLQAGALICGSALRRLVDRAAQAGAALPRCLDVDGQELGDELSAGACLAFARTKWQEGLAEQTPYRTHLLFQALARDFRADRVRDAVVVTAGRAGRAVRGRGAGLMTFDQRLLAGQVPAAGRPPERVLVVMLRTFGDCVLATPVLSALRGRWPSAAITVLTEPRYAWIFASHPVVSSVLTAAIDGDRDLFWREDMAIAAATRAHAFDRLVVLSDRLDHVTYHHSGRSLQSTYFAQAGLEHVVDVPGELFLPAERLRERDATLHGLGLVAGGYAVLHCRAGWPEKSLPDGLALAIVAHLRLTHRLPVVTIGGEGDTAPSGSIDLCGKLSMAASAALIAGASVFVGPDSGPLHVASATGVRCLALYAGSSPLVAPPTVAGSICIQSPSTCPVPCGVSPCPERSCGFTALDQRHVLARLDDVMSGGSLAGSYCGGTPALYMRARDGGYRIAPARDPRTEGGLLLDERGDASGHGLRMGTRSAATGVLEVDASAPAVLAHARSVLIDGASPGPGEVPHGGRAPLLPLDLARMGLPGRMASLFTLIGQSAERRLPLRELAFAGDALAAVTAACRGDGERARPAAREFADEAMRYLFRCAVQIDPSGSTLAAAVQHCRGALGTAPPAAILLGAVLASSDAPATASAVIGEIRLMHDRCERLDHGACLGLARLLAHMGHETDAEIVLERNMGRLDRRATPQAYGETLLAHALLCGRHPQRLREALDKARAALAVLAGPPAEAARELVQALAKRAPARPSVHSSELLPNTPSMLR